MESILVAALYTRIDKGIMMKKTVLYLTLTIALTSLLAPEPAWSQMPRRRRSDAAADQDAEAMRVDRRAHAMIDSAVELLEQRQEERAVRILEQVPQMFPDARARFRAYVVLGDYHMENRNYDGAVAQFRQVQEGAREEDRAAALLKTGICYYQMSDYDQAFIALRRVTSEFRWSDDANEAFYYIGMCHFNQGRWTQAEEALRMVGTSVPPADFQDGDILAEAGHRLYVKVQDRDLPVLSRLGQETYVDVVAQSGDRERMLLEPQGQGSDDFIGSIRTEPGQPSPGDGILQIRGGDTVTVEYIDVNTESGDLNKKRLATIRMVSTAAIGFTDGAFIEYVNGVFGDQRAFIRVKDLDHDRTPGKDTITVHVRSRFKLERDDDVSRQGFELDEQEQWEERDRISVQLTETEPHSGIFVGTFVPRVIGEGVQAGTPGMQIPGDIPHLQVRHEDAVELEYTDELHIHGSEPRHLSVRVPVVIGQLANVESIVYETTDVNLQARKLLVEAKIFLRWAEIFDQVGLNEHRNVRSEEGLSRVETVIRLSTRESLERALVEDAFRVKWELLMTQGRLREAIAASHQLTRLFPDSRLADQAFLQIAKAELETGNARESIPLFQAVLSLPNASAEVKGEAQYSIGLAEEKLAVEFARERSTATREVRPNMTRAIAAYRRTAEAYPDSHYAGEALQKIVNYYILYQDYARAIELIERVMVDYPDKSWLHEMLLKWGIAAFRMRNYELSHAKFQQILEQYPGTSSASQARRFLEVVERRLPSG